MGWDKSYTPLTRPRLNPPPGRWPPAGVSNQLLPLAGSHNIACKLHAITEDFQSSREAPKPYFPTFAALPSENNDFHEKKPLLPAAQHASAVVDPYFLGGPKSMKNQGNPPWRHFRRSEPIPIGRRGRPSRS